MIILFYGNGKGKTSAAIATALRAIASKKQVVIIQFLKPGTSGEIKLLQKLKSSTIKQFNNVTMKNFGKKTLTNPKKLSKHDFKLVIKALDFTNSAILKKPFLLILDEILVAIKFKLLDESVVIDIIQKCRKNNIHLILTGRDTTKKLIKKSDLVTDMKNVKHPFEKGKRAVKGIDF